MSDVDDWRTQAVCREADPELWFSDKPFDLIAARTICEDCPVRPDCLLDGIDDQHGIWAGFSATERRRLRQRLTRADDEARRAVIAAAAVKGPRALNINDLTN